MNLNVKNLNRLFFKYYIFYRIYFNLWAGIQTANIRHLNWPCFYPHLEKVSVCYREQPTNIKLTCLN